jgi:hypothetical protein
VADVRHGQRQQRGMLAHERRPLDRLVSRQGADHQSFPGQANPIQPGHSIDVDDGARGGEPHVEGRHQALTAGQDPAVVTVAIEQIDDLDERRRAVIIERGWLHGGLSCPSQPAR